MMLNSQSVTGRLTSWLAVRQFVLAGNATFTLRSVATGQRFTYRVRERRQGVGQCWFVSLLRGPSNEDDYAYMGLIDNSGFHCTAKSRVTVDAPSHKAFAWFYRRMVTGCKAQSDVDAALEVWHENKCGRCGRKLTVPESVASGIGPECAERMVA